MPCASSPRYRQHGLCAGHATASRHGRYYRTTSIATRQSGGHATASSTASTPHHILRNHTTVRYLAVPSLCGVHHHHHHHHLRRHRHRHRHRRRVSGYAAELFEVNSPTVNSRRTSRCVFLPFGGVSISLVNHEICGDPICPCSSRGRIERKK